MSVIFILVGFSLLAALFFLGSFIWAVKNGQYDDDYTPSVRMLFDDDDIQMDDPQTRKSNLNK
ncbi:MAG: cbb3-type cytochrome oxidase assembly protein CcoS [Salibacteraceae bacterium]